MIEATIFEVQQYLTNYKNNKKLIHKGCLTANMALLLECSDYHSEEDIDFAIQTKSTKYIDGMFYIFYGCSYNLSISRITYIAKILLMIARIFVRSEIDVILNYLPLYVDL